MIVLNGQTDVYLDARHDSCSFVTCPTPYNVDCYAVYIRQII